MKCPFCADSTRVTDSRPTLDGIRRRRECSACGRRFTTHERLASSEIAVVKAGGRAPEPFQLEKLIESLRRVSKHCAVQPEQIEILARAIETELIRQRRKRVHSIELAKMVLARLEDLNRLAFHRFAANYSTLDGSLDLTIPPFQASDEVQIPLFDDAVDDED